MMETQPPVRLHDVHPVPILTEEDTEDDEGEDSHVHQMTQQFLFPTISSYWILLVVKKNKSMTCM